MDNRNGGPNDELLRRIASEYVERSGREALAEARALDDDPRFQAPDTLKQRTLRKISAPKRKRNVTILVTLAACLLLAVVGPYLLSQSQQSPPVADGGAAAGDTADGTAPTPPAGDDDAEAPTAPDGDAADEAPDAEDPAGERIELQLELPAHFALSDVEEDNGRTIYYIDHEQLDDVVLSVHHRSEPLSTAGMNEMEIGGHPVWVQTGPDYQLLTFERDDIVYVLTCRYELVTLVELAQSLLE